MSQETDAKVREVTARYEREAKEAEARAQQALAARSQEDAYDRRLRERREQEAKEAQERARQENLQVQQQQATTEQQKWMAWVDGRIRAHFQEWFGTMFDERCEPLVDVIGKFAADERRKMRAEIDEAVTETKNWFEGRIETKILPRLETIEQRVAQYAGRVDGLGAAIEQERRDRREEVATAAEVLQRTLETRIEATTAAFETRVTQQIGQYVDRAADALDEAIATERADRQREIDTALGEVRHALEEKTETKLAALEARCNALLPAKLPIARAYCADTVHYAGQVVVHCGASYQAVRDTARAPPHGDDWICLAGAGRDGRDGRTPVIRGTFDVRERYTRLDIAVRDGAAFIATRDNPGICPGDGWQLIAQQGRRGPRGECGPRGEKGEARPAIMPKLISSKIDEHYNLTLLREDKSLEIIPLREAFERFFNETGGGE